MRDPHYSLAIKPVVAPQACGATGTGITGKVIDRTLGETNGFQGVEFEFSYGSITATGATFTQKIFEGAATGALTTVAASNLLGANLGPAVGARVSGTNKNCVKRTGYVGIQRYVSAKIISTVTAGALVGINCILGLPDVAPTAT